MEKNYIISKCDDSEFCFQPQGNSLIVLCEEKGVIIVSHRVGVVHLADRVVFMKSGKIVCEGKHNDLMQKNQSYREFYKSQAKWYV